MLLSIIKEISQIPFEQISKVIFSGGKNTLRRITLRPVHLKGEQFLQCEKTVGTQVFHTNIAFNAVSAALESLLADNTFSDINIFTRAENIAYHISKKGNTHKTITRLNEKREVDTAHNKEKKYIITDGMRIPALVSLGIFDENFTLKKRKSDKFVQINKYLEIIDAELKNYAKDAITVIDFGCGKSYLTFIVYYYLTEIKKLKTVMLGYDLKQEVIEECRTIAKQYGYDGIQFHAGDIASAKNHADKADMMLTLHACDTATDYALCHAVKTGIEYIFSVPCCQQELGAQIALMGDLVILGKHGLYKERFSALLTDAIRCEVLREFGYSVDVIEFVDFSNTPKNAMIRAKKIKSHKTPPDLKQMDALSDTFGVSHTLVKLMR